MKLLVRKIESQTLQLLLYLLTNKTIGKNPNLSKPITVPLKEVNQATSAWLY